MRRGLRVLTVPLRLYAKRHLVRASPPFLIPRVLTFPSFLLGSKCPGTAKTNAIVLLSAHCDSRGSFDSVRAPGGDDDGSGTTAILALACTIGSTGVRFHDNVERVLFGGEEQGANVTLMVQVDMLVYHGASAPSVNAGPFLISWAVLLLVPEDPSQLGLLLTRISSLFIWEACSLLTRVRLHRIGKLEVTQLVSNLFSLYAPELTVGYTAACCSNRQNFWEQGFPVTQIFERAGPVRLFPSP
jgi:hypothetical protein